MNIFDPHTSGGPPTQPYENSIDRRAFELVQRSFREMEKLARLGAWCFIPSTNEVWWSRGTFAIHGMPYSRSLSVDEALQDYNAADRALLDENIREAWTADTTFECFATIVSKDGMAKRLRIVGHREEIGGRETVFGVTQDVSLQYDTQVETAWLADHDALTKALNRRAFLTALDRQFELNRPVNVILFDMDDLKVVNDTLGHAAGDRAISTALETVQQWLPEGLLGRLGGDEFAVMWLPEDHTDEIVRLRSLLDDLSGAIQTSYGPLSIACSAGVARSTAGDTCKTIMQKADIALYNAKQERRGNFTLHDPKLTHASNERARVIKIFKSAIIDDSLSTAFQPIVDAQSEEVKGFEALMRIGSDIEKKAHLDWSHAFQNSDISMSVFLSVLEDAAKFASAADVSVHVNATFHDIVRSDFLEKVADTLATFAVKPASIVFELTESAILHGKEALAHQAVDRIVAAGHDVALDDFGTGYSSLTHLYELPISEVKIDKKFVQSLATDRSAAIVSGVVGICRSQGIKVIAEGIETLAHKQLANAAGCNALQGYYFGKPSIAEFWLNSAVLSGLNGPGVAAS